MYFCPFLIILHTKRPLQSPTMAACGSLEHIFEKPLPENPTLLESLSPWKHIKSMKPIDDSSFTEIFGELHFKENHLLSSSSPKPSSSSSSSHLDESPVAESITSLRSDSNSSCPDEEKNKNPTWIYYPTSQKREYRQSDSFSSMNSESLSLCTEGLGFESFDDVEDLVKYDVCNEWRQQEERRSSTRNIQTENHLIESKKSGNRGEFPPPISCIGKSGKPWVCFKSYRENGRFILKEVRIPTQEFLHACRENGRLKLQFIQSDDEILEENEEEEEEEEEEDDVEEQFEDTSNDNDDDDDDDDKQEQNRNGDYNR